MDDLKTPYNDVESPAPSVNTPPKVEEGIIEDFVTPRSLTHAIRKLTQAGVELRSLEPVPPERRTHTRYYNVMTLFGGSFFSILP